MNSVAPPAPSPEGVITVDTRYARAQFDAAYLLVRDGRTGIVDCGTNSSVPHLLEALDRAGLGRDSVDWLLVTHVHLDHAGGAGALLAELPNARLIAHPRAVKHLVDPTQLAGAAAAVYGQAKFDSLYGQLLPVPASRVEASSDRGPLELGSARFELLHTPGHALHHHVLHDPAAGAVLTGDAFGLAYPALSSEGRPFIFPTTSPSQFDPEQMLSSIDRIAGLKPNALYPTHYGRVPFEPPLAAALRRRVLAHVAAAESLDAWRRAQAGVGGDSSQGETRVQKLETQLRDWAAQELAEHGVQPNADSLDWLAGDVRLNAQGLESWLHRRARAAGGGG